MAPVAHVPKGEPAMTTDISDKSSERARVTTSRRRLSRNVKAQTGLGFGEARWRVVNGRCDRGSSGRQHQTMRDRSRREMRTVMGTVSKTVKKMRQRAKKAVVKGKNRIAKSGKKSKSGKKKDKASK